MLGIEIAARTVFIARAFVSDEGTTDNAESNRLYS
jgi:hypothetical protein